MPAYAYECLSCDSHFDLRQKMSDPELDACPSCGGTVHRLISGGAGILTRGASSAPAPPSACDAGDSCCMSDSSCGTGCAAGACAWEN